jgi:hypothetical protein
MSLYNRTVYFSSPEIKEALKHFSSECKANHLEKIDYKIWRKLNDSPYGIYVICEKATDVGGYSSCTMYFFEASDQGMTVGDIIFACDSYSNDFGWFFYKNCYTKHKDYIEANSSLSIEEEANMISNSTSTSTSSNVAYYDNGNATKCDLIIKNDYGKDYIEINDYRNQIHNLEYSLQSLATKVESINLTKEKEKENKNMKGFNFDFGPCTNDNIKMSVYGLAVQNATGDWVSYDTKSGTIMNVDLLNFDGRKFMYKMPVVIKDIAKGDIVIHNKVPMFVLDVKDGGVVAVDVRAGEEKKILPTNSPFGFNFMTKVVSFFNMFADAPTPDTPFGNFLPFMMMGENGGDIDPFVLCMMMQNSGGAANFFSNPMMMYFFMKDNKNDKDWLLPMMMMNQSTQKPTVNK